MFATRYIFYKWFLNCSRAMSKRKYNYCFGDFCGSGNAVVIRGVL